MIENLNQLKRALRPGIRLQIVDHRRTECINQLREVTWITSNGFCTKVLNQPADKIDAGNNGRGAMLWWGPASTWTFENGVCSSFTYGGNRKETLIIAFRVLNEEVPSGCSAVTSVPVIRPPPISTFWYWGMFSAPASKAACPM